METTENSLKPGGFAGILHPQGRFLPRLAGVLRFERETYREIEDDPQAIPQAFAAVIGTAVLTGLGQGSLAGIFLGIAGGIFVWLVATGLVWTVGAFGAGPAVEFPRLMRCLGFGYIWFGLLIGGGLPFLGVLISWASLGLCGASLVMATQQVFRATAQRALGICVVALGTPVVLLLWVAG